MPLLLLVLFGGVVIGLVNHTYGEHEVEVEWRGSSAEMPVSMRCLSEGGATRCVLTTISARPVHVVLAASCEGPSFLAGKPVVIDASLVAGARLMPGALCEGAKPQKVVITSL